MSGFGWSTYLWWCRNEDAYRRSRALWRRGRALWRRGNPLLVREREWHCFIGEPFSTASDCNIYIVMDILFSFYIKISAVSSFLIFLLFSNFWFFPLVFQPVWYLRIPPLFVILLWRDYNGSWFILFCCNAGDWRGERSANVMTTLDKHKQAHRMTWYSPHLDMWRISQA